MARRVRESVDPAALPAPAVIARQIVADLARAQRHFAAVARGLEAPSAEEDGEQLSFPDAQ